MLRQLDRLGPVGLQTGNLGILYVLGSYQEFQTLGLLVEIQRQTLLLSILAEHVRGCQFPLQSMRDTGGRGHLAYSFCAAFLVWEEYRVASSTERIGDKPGT